LVMAFIPLNQVLRALYYPNQYSDNIIRDQGLLQIAIFTP